jgi:putative lipoprotein
MHGLLVFGHEVRSLKLCGDSKVFWVRAPAPLRQRLQASYRHLAKRAYAPVYVEIDGDFSDSPAGGFAAGYAGTIVVSAVRSVSGNGVEACGAALPPTSLEPPAAVDSAATYVFVCDDQTAYTVRVGDAEAWVFHPRDTLRLPAVPAKTGARYSNATFDLRIEGQQARLGEVGSELQPCHNDRRRAVWENAKLGGADFRAVGNEPGWNLEILAGSRIVLVTDYGASRVERPLPEPTVDSDARTTRWVAGDLVVEIIGRPCRDSMSGEPFESTVRVTWEGQLLRGCGRALH